ncbi:MAG: hypothetical protein PUD53_06145 [Oscillospiraceae bacterium]|nr:hypothetical protein [Oscillospiraceae bacterium]
MKKFLTVLLAGIMLLSLVACDGDGKAVTITQVCDDDDTMSATVTVGYKDGTTPSETGTDEAELINEEKDFSVEFYLYFDNGLDYFVDDAKKEKTYKEVKYSGFDGYMYQYDDYEYEICLYLDEKDDYDVYLFAYVAPGSELIDTETTDMEALFNQEDVQNILNSVKYEGIEKTSK